MGDTIYGKKADKIILPSVNYYPPFPGPEEKDASLHQCK
jgi:hypothetical protein